MINKASPQTYSVVKFTGQELLVLSPTGKKLVGEIDPAEKLLILRPEGETDPMLQPTDVVLIIDPRHVDLVPDSESSYLLKPFHATFSTKKIITTFFDPARVKPFTGEDLAKLWVVPFLVGDMKPRTLQWKPNEVQEPIRTIRMPRNQANADHVAWPGFRLSSIQIYQPGEFSASKAEVIQKKKGKAEEKKSWPLPTPAFVWMARY